MAYNKCEDLLRMATTQCATGEYYAESFLRDYLNENFFLVAENDRGIIGCIFGEMIQGNGAIVWVIAVSQKHKGSGTGSSLIKSFERNCKKLGIQWIILYAPQKKNKTCEFYQKHQFHKGITCIEFVKIVPKKH